MSRRRFHQPYETGGAPTAPYGRQRRQSRKCRLDVASGLGGRTQTAASCGSGTPAGAGASIRPPAPTTVRSRGSAPTPASRAAPAAPPRCLRPPVGASSPLAGPPGIRGPAAAARHVPPPRAAPVRRSAAPSAAEGRWGPARWPSRARSRTTPAPGRPRRAVDGAGARWARWRPCPEQPPGTLMSYAALSGECVEFLEWRRAEALGGARVFARSGGNRGAPHGLSLLAGKTSLVRRGDTWVLALLRSPSAY